MVRRLDERQRWVSHQPAHGHLQEGTGRNVVAIEHGDELALGQRHRVVQVAGLGVRVVRANDVARTTAFGEVAERAAAAVVEDVDAQPVARPVDRLSREHGGPDNLQVLVIRRNIHVDARPVRRIGRQRHRLALQRPDGLDVAQRQHDDGVEFRQRQAGAEETLQHGVEVQRLGEAPDDVAQRHQAGEHGEEQRHRPPRAAVADDEHEHRDAAKDGLLERIEHHGGGDEHQRQADQREEGQRQPLQHAWRSRAAAQQPAQQAPHRRSHLARRGRAAAGAGGARRPRIARAIAAMSCVALAAGM